MSRIFLALTILAGAAFLVLSAWIAPAEAREVSGWKAYSPASFETLRASGRPIVVDVHASWCPTCRVQAGILDRYRKSDAFGDVAFVRVDYDNDRQFLKDFRIPRQSTILVFKGGREVGRSVAETNPEKLGALLKRAL
ncbi:thioredoxin family protein [Paraurantiacibacter namhicola]|uniref:Thioredoxin n=1 Tax=Paraurantiacibacter namhicola TaxID=645517 RepID=A0A1C7D4U5_9SPHN|nr:thioredoxin family protein [Paraurantiacibacter namhicola]ANU06485.1 Thioredoxin [Paraurantiacibacter namhicola]